ncbi:hypothetical protein Bca4012_082695 [Brassica carinata]
MDPTQKPKPTKDESIILTFNASSSLTEDHSVSVTASQVLINQFSSLLPSLYKLSQTRKLIQSLPCSSPFLMSHLKSL